MSILGFILFGAIPSVFTKILAYIEDCTANIMDGLVFRSTGRTSVDRKQVMIVFFTCRIIASFGYYLWHMFRTRSFKWITNTIDFQIRNEAPCCTLE